MRRSQTRHIAFYRFWPRIPGITWYLCLALLCTACGNTPATAQPSSTSQPTTSATSTPTLHVTPAQTLQPGPPPRTGAEIAYDEKTKMLVLFGGYDYTGHDNGLNDTWTWDRTTWTRHHPVASPSLPSNAIDMSMAYNAGTRHIALMIHSQELWTWNGSTWSRASLQNPAEDRGLLFYKPDQQALFALTETVVVEGAGRCVDKLWKLTDQGWQPLPAWD